MNGMSCKSYKTYKKALDELILFGFVKMVKQSVNQYQCNIIALVNNTEASTNALTKSLLKQIPKQVHITDQSTSHIHKPQTLNLEQQTIPEIEIPAEPSLAQMPNPKARKKRKVAAKEKKAPVISESGQNFAAWYAREMKPASMKVGENDLINWGKTYDQLIKLEYKREDIGAAVRWARQDKFWCKVFQSPMKLNRKNDDGVRYIDVFLDQRNTEIKAKKQPTPDLPYVS